MATAAPLPCTEPLCPLYAAPKNRGKCLEHTRVPWASSRPMPKGWSRISTRFLRQNPFCASCNGVASQVDHIIPRAMKGAETSPTNLQSLCASCHEEKTLRDKKAIEAWKSTRLIEDRNLYETPF